MRILLHDSECNRAIHTCQKLDFLLLHPDMALCIWIWIEPVDWFNVVHYQGVYVVMEKSQCWTVRGSAVQFGPWRTLPTLACPSQPAIEKPPLNTASTSSHFCALTLTKPSLLQCSTQFAQSVKRSECCCMAETLSSGKHRRWSLKPERFFQRPDHCSEEVKTF